MTGGRVGSGRGDVPLLFEGGSAVALGDGELLGRFLARRDEAAFEALVARLGPTVLGVCRRMLADPHDVDDAFQATFLVLVRRAGSIRDRDRVATWTYEVAVRVARRARIDAARRSARERLGCPSETSEIDTRVDRSELRAQIDEEIARLPDNHRRVVLLCDAEGLSREEAAARLGWTPNMVRGRLDRARAKLRDRLSRRGLAPSDAWMTWIAPLPVPRAALVLATARAALGRGSAAALALSKGAGLMMILHEWKPIAALILAAGSATLVAATAGPGWVAGPEQAQQIQPPAPQVARPAEPKPRRPLIDIMIPPGPVPTMSSGPRRDPKAPRPSMDTAPESVPVRISGLVRDLAGKPIAGATISVLGTKLSYGATFEGKTAVAGSTTTGADGRYRLTSPIPTSRDQGSPQALTPHARFQVVAQAPGFGIGWHGPEAMYAVPLIDPDDIQGYLPLNSPFEMDLYLRPEGELKGRVVDEAGRPVAGVKIQNHVIVLLNERGAETKVNFQVAPGILPGGFDRAVTDGDGRFRMPGLPWETCSWLSFDRPGSNMQRWLHASTSAEAETEHAIGGPVGLDEPKRHQAFPADMTVELANPRRVEVRVVADDDGKPVPDVQLRTEGKLPTIGLFAQGRSDAEGKVAIDLPPGHMDALWAEPTSGDSRFVRTYLRPFVVAPEPAVQPLEFKMRAGAEVFIEVVDADTGRGIPDVHFEIKAEGKGGDWASLPKSTHMGADAATDAAGKARAVLDPARKGSRQVRVAGVGLEESEDPADPARPRAGPARQGQPRLLPYEAVQGRSEPFELSPGKPVNLRFTLRQK